MKRRTLLRGVAGLLAGAGLAGCTGAGGEVPVTAEPPPSGLPTETAGSDGVAPSTPSSESLVSITDFGGRADDDGGLVATVTVANESDRTQVRLVRATVAIADLRTSGGRFVRLAPGESRTVAIPLDVSYEAWATSGSLTPQVVRRTPATPVPTDAETPTETPAGAAASPTSASGSDAGSQSGTDAESTTATSSTATSNTATSNIATE